MDTQSSWNWAGINDESVRDDQSPPQPPPETSRSQPYGGPPPEAANASRTRSKARTYGPRTCRICLETEHPKWPEDQTSTLGISAQSSKPTYVSDDAELGRLLSPCKCKGSQKYVHEGCLNAWRLANPSASRNYWQCPTCKFTYRMSRLSWASMLSSKLTQLALTFVLSVICIFALGFIADPLLDLWFDPVGTIGESVINIVSDVEAREEPPLYYDEPETWYEHFLKGFFSLGLVGIAKSMIAMTPWHWWNLRGAMGTGRRQGTGRARAENMSLIFVAIGAFTFLGAMWKAVRALSGRLLKNVSDRVMDVDEGEGEEEDDDANTGSAQDHETRKSQ